MDLLIKIIADLPIIIVVLLSIYILLIEIPNKEKYQKYSVILMAGLSVYLVAKIIGLLYQPNNIRPFELLGVEAKASFLNNPGFPSDHALLAFFLVITIYFVTKNKLITFVIFVLVSLMSIGRVAALVHTPLDILGGLLISLVSLFWYIPLFKKNNKV